MLLPFVLFVTGVVTAVVTLGAYLRTRDALHPAVFIGPMLFYQFVYRPWVLYMRGELQEYFPNTGHLEYAAFIHLIGIGAFCAGIFPKRRELARDATLHRYFLSPEGEKALVRIAVIFAIIASAAYYLQVFSHGGFSAVYGRAKGYLGFSSGYLAEATGLAVPAAILLVFAWRRERWTLWGWAVVLAAISPVLLHAILGARRGPAFLSLGGLAFAWFLFRARRPRIVPVLVTVGAICFVVVFLFVNRPRIYVGSNEALSVTDVFAFLTPSEAGAGDDYLVAAGTITVSHETGRYGWGRNYLITFLIRPIPRQLWPTQYQDARRFLFGDSPPLGPDKYREILGWDLVGGSASGAFADLYREFALLFVLAAYLYGAFFNLLWRRARIQHGVWLVLFTLAAALSIYVPTQSVSAVFHRFLFAGIPTLILWKAVIPEMRVPGSSVRVKRSPLTHASELPR